MKTTPICTRRVKNGGGEKLYDFRFYELEIVSYSLPLAVFRWDTYARNDSFHRHCDFYELVLVYRGSARNDNGTGRLETVTVGNVFLLPPGSIHRYQAIHEFAHFNILFRAGTAESGPVRS